MCHTARLDACLKSWFALTATLRDVYIPSDERLCKVMLRAVLPDKLHNRIRCRISNGLGPYVWSLTKKKWRQDAEEKLWLMRRLIREHTDYWDDVCMSSDNGKGKCNEYMSNDAAE